MMRILFLSGISPTVISLWKNKQKKHQKNVYLYLYKWGDEMMTWKMAARTLDYNFVAF